MAKLTVESIKSLGSAKNRSEENLTYLIDLFNSDVDTNQIPVDVKREIVSSIGRQNNKERVAEFLKKWAVNSAPIPMEVRYQMFRSALYLSPNNEEMRLLVVEMLNYYHNEVMDKMYNYFYRKQHKNYRGTCNVHVRSPITQPLTLLGDAKVTLQESLPSSSVQLVFTSPPYYNAREYTNYHNYKEYLEEMRAVFKECSRVLEAGRFMIVNVSPVITKRTGREFESIRYPIHYDFHTLLCESEFYFVDEIYWVKPEPSVPNRIGGYLQTRKPLGYKPNCITESIMVYRKNCDFLLDEIMAKYQQYDKNQDEDIDTSNCWYITPKSDKEHPAVFPEELCRRVLKYYSFEGDVVLDPFAGSGTVGRAATRMGRIPVLCEVNPQYFELIKKREMIS